ncbi:hypothetical protein CHS0354_016141 [Potamilus streckersoni]|uniref:Uncharacterized protein n=1 Tax=Potamilus streckersoni TaxID=2493646 RepID=A0AAE0T0Y0_9BIVA|nr:hypothetical protein CHS0354_016141 [Potamilus streckersoni]
MTYADTKGNNLGRKPAETNRYVERIEISRTSRLNMEHLRRMLRATAVEISSTAEELYIKTWPILKEFVILTSRKIRRDG